jgi:hypothetical protein
MVTKIVFRKKFFRKQKMDIYFCPFFKFPKKFCEKFLCFFDVTEKRTCNYYFGMTAYYHDENDNFTVFVLFEVSIVENGT